MTIRWFTMHDSLEGRPLSIGADHHDLKPDLLATELDGDARAQTEDELQRERQEREAASEAV